MQLGNSYSKEEIIKDVLLFEGREITLNLNKKGWSYSVLYSDFCKALSTFKPILADEWEQRLKRYKCKYYTPPVDRVNTFHKYSLYASTDPNNIFNWIDSSNSIEDLKRWKEAHKFVKLPFELTKMHYIITVNGLAIMYTFYV